MNRDILSFFNTNEFDINVRYNDDVNKLRCKLNFKPEIDLNKYIKDNNIKIKKLYPIERIYRTIHGKKYLRDKYGI